MEVVIAGDFRNGVTFEMEGKVVQVLEFQHVKPGKGAAFVRTKLKDVINGAVIEKTFNPTDKFEGAYIERRDMEYLYNDGDLYYFMDPETYELTLVGDFSFDDGFPGGVVSIFSNPETGEFYTLGLVRGWVPGISSLDITTGERTVMWRVTDIPGADQLETTYWAACMIDATTVAVWGYFGDIGLYDLETGKALGYIDMNLTDPLYDCLQIGINGIGGSMIYNKDNNDLYCFSNWAELGFDRYQAQGRIRVDLDTNTTTLEPLGNNKLGVNGLFFKEDAVPTDWYIVLDMINQIGDVELSDGDLIKAAREAYDALTESKKALVEN